MSEHFFKILVINWQDISNPYAGGAEVHFHEIFKRVAAGGYQVTLICCKYKGAPSFEVIDGIHIVRMGNRSFFNYCVPFIYWKLRKKMKFDLVFDDINKIPFFTPLFVTEPIVGIVHHLFGKSIYLEASFPAASYVYYLERLVPHVYRQIPFAVVSESTRQELSQAGVKGQIESLPNGVDLNRYQVNLNNKSETPLIGYLGRLKRYKSIEHILKAMPAILDQVPKTRLIIIGGGDNEAALKKMSSSLGIEKDVEFVGFVTNEEKVALLEKIWLIVNPSSKEGWGLTVIEANACRLPVVAANSPGLRDAVVHDKTGRLYPYGDVQQLAEEVIDLLNDQQKRNYFSEQAYHWAEKFSWEKSAKKAKKMIEEFGYKKDA